MPKVRYICLCTPSLGQVSVWWTRQMMKLLWPLNIGKMLMFEQDSVGGEIAEARNAIVAKCLNLEASGEIEVDSLFWVDDDVLVTMGALLSLYEHHVPIASGVYFTKGEPGQPLIFPGRLHGTAEFVPDTVMRGVWGHGMGLTLVKADVYKRMLVGGLPTDKYGRPEWYKTNRGYKVDPEAKTLDCGGTEDLYFLDAASKLGYSSVVDCRKHAFGFHYDAAKRTGYPERQWNDWSAARPITWDTKSGPVVWE